MPKSKEIVGDMDVSGNGGKIEVQYLFLGCVSITLQILVLVQLSLVVSRLPDEFRPQVQN